MTAARSDRVLPEFAPPRFVTVGGRRLAYEEVSPPDPEATVLLLCGIGAKRQGWYKQLPVLGRRFRTLALDYRDVGDSDPAGEPYTIAEVADDVAALAQELGIERASLVGISMGGFIALELALRRPALVDKLILVVTSAGGPTHVSTSPEIMRLLMPGDEQVETGAGARRVCAAVAGPGFADREPEEIDAFVAIARHRPMTREAYLRQLEACRAHDVSDRLDAHPRADAGHARGRRPARAARERAAAGRADRRRHADRVSPHRPHPRGRARATSSTAT